MRLIALLALLLPSLALAQVTIGPGAHTGPRILGEVSTEYCPMLTHGKCTDGKTILTTRSTPVPCGSGTAGVDVGCYQGGLESYPQVVNYAADSANPSLWPTIAGATVEGNIVTSDVSGTDQGIRAGSTTPTNGDWTVSCILRAGTATSARLRLNVSGGTGSVVCPVTLTATPQRHHCTGTVASGTNVGGQLYVGAGAVETGSIIVDQCQLEKASTPGRRCDAGATPATCAGDRHARSTVGWPTEIGKICAHVRLGTSSQSQFLIDGRVSNATATRVWFNQAAGYARLQTGTEVATLTGVVPASVSRVCVERRLGLARIEVDGRSSPWVSMPPWFWTGSSAVGVHNQNQEHLNGTISRLEWSNQ